MNNIKIIKLNLFKKWKKEKKKKLGVSRLNKKAGWRPGVCGPRFEILILMDISILEFYDILDI